MRNSNPDPLMQFSETDEFKKEFKRLKKKYATLSDDYENLKKVLVKFPRGTGSRHCNKLKEAEESFVFKARMMCRSVRGATFRVVYFLDAENDKIVFIEIYFKGEQENENRERIDVEFARLIIKNNK